MSVLAIRGVAEFRPGSPGPFVLAKGPKTNDALPAASEWTDAMTGKAGQLAEPVLTHAEGLKQGPPIDTSLRPEGG